MIDYFLYSVFGWLVILIQFTGIITYYRHYKVFPSDYVKNLVVTPLLEQRALWPALEIFSIDIKPSTPQSYPVPSKPRFRLRYDYCCQFNTTRSGKVFKNTKSNYSTSEIRKRFGKQSKKELSHLQTLLDSAILEYSGRLHLRCNITNSIRTPDLGRKWKREFVEIGVNSDCTINGQNITATLLINQPFVLAPNILLSQIHIRIILRTTAVCLVSELSLPKLKLYSYLGGTTHITIIQPFNNQANIIQNRDRIIG